MKKNLEKKYETKNPFLKIDDMTEVGRTQRGNRQRVQQRNRLDRAHNSMQTEKQNRKRDRRSPTRQNDFNGPTIRSANRQQPSQSTTNPEQRSYSSRQSYQQQDRSYAGTVRNNPTTQQVNKVNTQSYYRDSGTYPNERRQGQILTNNRNQIQENTSAKLFLDRRLLQNRYR